MEIFKPQLAPQIPLADRKAKKFGESEGTPVGYDWVVSTVEEFIEEMDKNISYAREIISKQAVVNQDKHPDITSAISEGWNNPALIPYSLYENLEGSQLASQKFIRELVLDVSRSIVGDNSIDVLDYFKCLRTEAEYFLRFVKRYPDMQAAQVEPCVYYASRLWACFNRMSLLKYNNSVSALETAVSDTSAILDQQKKIHSFIIKTNKIISADKALLSNITIESSEKYFSEKLPSQMTQGSFIIDAKEMFKKRIDAIEEISNDIQDSISAVNSMRLYHSQLGESPDGVAPEDVTAGFIVQNDPVGIADANNAAQVLKNNIEAPTSYFQSMVFTATDNMSAYDVIDLLNNLPATHTYIRAGLISVAAEWEFINELIENINNQPDNSTLISGGLISLRGTSLDSWGANVEVTLEDIYSQAYLTASGVIDAVNDYHDGGGMSIFTPGMIGLADDYGSGPSAIRAAILDKLNETTTSSGNSTLIGPGVILVNGSDTLDDRWPVWEGDISNAAGVADDAAAAAIEAQTTANSATGSIANIASDNILSPVEKPTIILDRDTIVAEQAGVSGQATTLSISATTYNTAITTLTNYLATLTTPTLWSNPTGDTTIVGPTFRAKFEDVYLAKQSLLNSIYAALKSLADSASAVGASGSVLINYWNLTNSTLIDGSSIGAGTVSLDKLVVGLSAVYTNTYEQISFAQFPGIGSSGDIDIGSIQSIQELRFGGPNFWPTDSEYFQYKILLRTSTTDPWVWFRGGTSNWSTSNRHIASDSDGTPSQPSAIIPFLGSQTKEIRFIFDSFYDNTDNPISASLIVPSGGLIVYGGTGLWDGSGIYTNSITIGSMEPEVQTTVEAANNVITNFDSRNDRIGSALITPSVAPSAITHSINTDGSSDLYFSWVY